MPLLRRLIYNETSGRNRGRTPINSRFVPLLRRLIYNETSRLRQRINGEDHFTP